MGRRGPPQWPPRAGLSLGHLAVSFLLGHSALHHNESDHFSALWRVRGRERVSSFPLDQVVRVCGSLDDFHPAEKEGQREGGGDIRWCGVVGSRGSKGQRKEHGGGGGGGGGGRGGGVGGGEGEGGGGRRVGGGGGGEGFKRPAGVWTPPERLLRE